VTSGADGAYSLGAVANPPTTPYKLSVAADGFITREQWVNWQSGARTGVTLDLIRNAAPFSAAFYNEFVRGTFGDYGSPAPFPVLRLREAPRIYLKTVDQNGRAVEPEVLAVVRDALGRGRLFRREVLRDDRNRDRGAARHPRGSHHARSRARAGLLPRLGPVHPTIPGNCPAGDLAPSERYHAAIAYARPRGNSDPDNDPSDAFSVSSDDALRYRILVKN